MSAETERLRRHRIAMERAMRDNVSLDEARRRIATEERITRSLNDTSASGRRDDRVRPGRQIPHQWWMDL